MAEKEVVETSEAQIAVHWQEEGYYYPSNEFVAQANMTDKGIYERFSLGQFSQLLQGIRRSLGLVRVLGRTF